MEKIEDIEAYEAEKEESRKNRRSNRVILIVVLIIMSIILGVVVYKVVDGIINKNKEPIGEVKGEIINLSDENVQILYDYVTFTAEGGRNKKFIEEKEVTLSSFTAEEKIVYALQFAQAEDFVFTGEYDENKQKIYSIEDQTIQKYIKTYFGPNAIYEKVETLTYPFTFYINGMNEGKLTYNEEREGYDATFTTKYEFKEDTNPVKPVYGQLISAMRNLDGSVVLQEKVVYTELKSVEDGGYTVEVYKDPEKTMVLDSITGITDETLETFEINLSKYNSTAIIEYTFGINGTALYFDSSKIIL